MTGSAATEPTGSPFRQPKAVWAVAFACVMSFMGIGLVDPIRPAPASQLRASPSQVELLFTRYLLIMAVAMLITGWVSSRIGAKRTLIVGLVLIVVFATLAGSANTINGIVGFRAGWGLGNALFIATSLAVIVASASGGFSGAIILYEAALGIGIAAGPLLGGELGGISRRGPFYGVAVLLSIALIATTCQSRRHPGRPCVAPRWTGSGPCATGPAHREHHRALLQLGLLHAAGLRALPDAPGRPPARLRLRRLGTAARDLLGVLPACSTLRDITHAVTSISGCSPASCSSLRSARPPS